PLSRPAYVDCEMWEKIVLNLLSNAFIGAAARALDAVEALEQARDFVGRDAGAGVAHGQLGRVIALAHRHHELAGEGELEGIGQEIEDDLFPHLAVDVRGSRQRWAVDDEPHAGLLDRRAEYAGELRR